jgi:Mrp family chromosome partitioning ATPase
VVVAARPGLGKTSFCLNVACHAAIRNGKRVGIFSLEMSKPEIMKRMISSESEVDAVSTPENSAEWSMGTPEDWATESLEAAKVAYCLPGTRTVMKSGSNLGEGYCRSMLPIVQRQLAKAGVRVAAVLNEIFR